MFVTRLISGIVLVAIALVTIGLGGWVLFATLLMISFIGAREFYKAMEVRKDRLSPLELGGIWRHCPVLSQRCISGTGIPDGGGAGRAGDPDVCVCVWISQISRASGHGGFFSASSM